MQGQLCNLCKRAARIICNPAGFALSALILGLAVSLTTASAEDWPKFGRDLANDSHSAEKGISSKNVTSLASKWTFATGSKVTTTPAIATIQGKHTVFVGAWNGVFYALDAVTGQQVWSFTVDYVGGDCNAGPPAKCRIGSSAAVDVSKNLVFFGAFNGYLYALNATNGQLVWKVLTGDSIAAGYEVWASPSVYNGMVFIGTSSHGDIPCIPGGSVIAYNELTGQPVWDFNDIDQSTCPGGGTCVGGSIWSSLAIDDVNGIVYAGTANPGSTCTPPTQNAGLYPDTVLALNANTGQLLNYFQAIQNDNADQDFGASPVLHSSGVNDQCSGQKVTKYWVSEGSKNGNLYTLGRNSHGLTGNTQQNVGGNAGEGIIATTGVLPATITKSCGGNLKTIEYVDGLFSTSVGGAFIVFQQAPGGTVTSRVGKQMSTSFFGAPAVIQDIALFGGKDGNLYASDYNGNILSTIPIGTQVVGGVSISNSRVYVGSSDGVVHCLSINGN
jgi:glucose dehydrogenase